MFLSKIYIPVLLQNLVFLGMRCIKSIPELYMVQLLVLMKTLRMLM